MEVKGRVMAEGGSADECPRRKIKVGGGWPLEFGIGIVAVGCSIQYCI